MVIFLPPAPFFIKDLSDIVGEAIDQYYKSIIKNLVCLTYLLFLSNEMD